MRSSSSIDLSRKITLLLIGKAGTGKTSFALSKFPRPYLLDVDDNMQSAIPRLRRDYPDLVFSYDILGKDDNDEPVPAAQQFTRMTALLETAQSSPEIDTIIVDSTTSLVDVFQVEARNRAKKSIESPMSYQDWGVFLELFKRFFKICRASTKHFVLIGHILSDKNEETGAFEDTIAVPGQMKTIITTKFTDVWQTFVEETVKSGSKVPLFKIRASPTSRIDLKNSRLLPPVFEADKVTAEQILSIPQLKKP